MTEELFHLVVIEDDPKDLFLISESLEKVGVAHRLTHLSDGGKALDFIKLAAASPDLVLLDLHLPKCDGIEVLQAMRSSTIFRDTPVIIVSTSRSAVDRVRLQELGAELFWSKPWNLDGFIDLAEIVHAIAAGRKK